MEDTEILFKDETYKIIGAAMEVYNELGTGFLENVYQEALAVEFKSRNIDFEKEKKIEITYKGHKLSQYYKVDFLCFNEIIVELKALSAITPDHYAQVMNYLKAMNKKVAVLINFGQSKLVFKRIII